MNITQMGAMKNHLHNLRVPLSGLCDSIVRRMNEWQKADGDGFAVKWRDSEAYQHLETALIKAREAERALNDAMTRLDYEKDHYGE